VLLGLLFLPDGPAPAAAGLLPDATPLPTPAAFLTGLGERRCCCIRSCTSGRLLLRLALLPPAKPGTCGDAVMLLLLCLPVYGLMERWLGALLPADAGVLLLGDPARPVLRRAECRDASMLLRLAARVGRSRLESAYIAQHKQQAPSSQAVGISCVCTPRLQHVPEASIGTKLQPGM
jgi:hypothetical protein